MRIISVRRLQRERERRPKTDLKRRTEQSLIVLEIKTDNATFTCLNFSRSLTRLATFDRVKCLVNYNRYFNVGNLIAALKSNNKRSRDKPKGSNEGGRVTL